MKDAPREMAEANEASSEAALLPLFRCEWQAPGLGLRSHRCSCFYSFSMSSWRLCGYETCFMIQLQEIPYLRVKLR
jgi:hypothetical protein